MLDIGLTPLTAEMLGEDVFQTLVGLVDIFPKLRRIEPYVLPLHLSWGWVELGAQMARLQEMRKSLPAVFTQ